MSSLDELTVQPGDLKIGTEGQVFKTVLGSCISVCIYAPKLQSGGIIHYVMPTLGNKKIDPSRYLHYGDAAIFELLREFKKMGCAPGDLVATIVGGANGENLENVSVGPENIRIARELLGRFGISIRAQSVGGELGRKMEFNTQSGDVRFSFLKKQQVPSTEVPQKLKLLMIEDSPAIQKLLLRSLSEFKDIEVVGVAGDTAQADVLRRKNRPDVITLDLHLPGENGVEYLRRTHGDGVPTLVVTSFNVEESDFVMQAFESGAFDCIEKPSASELPQFSSVLVKGIRAAAKSAQKRRPSLAPAQKRMLSTPLEFSPSSLQHGLIAIGASTGGTEAIKSVLKMMPKHIPPTVIVQHMPPVFTKSFADRLSEVCPFLVKEAVADEKLAADTVYIAPGGRHMRVVEGGGILRIQITQDPPVNLFRPSVDYLFSSLVPIRSKTLVAALLTGMGSDGARELLKLRQKEVFTIAQDEETCVVYGMPQAAVELGAAAAVLPLDAIAGALVNSLNGAVYKAKRKAG